MTAPACPRCAAGSPRYRSGPVYFHAGDVADTVTGCHDQPGRDADAFNRAVDAVVDAILPRRMNPAEEADYLAYFGPGMMNEYESPFAYSYSVCPVCGRPVLPGDTTSGQMHGRPLHARCMAEYTADVDRYDGREGRR